MLKIAIACNDIRPDGRQGGIAVYTGHLAKGLAERGHQVTVLGAGAKLESATNSGAEYVFLPPVKCWNPHPKLAIVADILARSRAVANYLATRDFDVAEVPIWNAEGWHAVKGRGPVVVRGHTPHDVVNELTRAAGMKVAKVDRIAAMLERTSARRATLYLANSQSSLESGQSRFGLDPRRTALCLHGVEMPDRAPVRSTAAGKGILFVGRLEARKGIPDLFRAIPLVLAKHPDAKFEIVGSDSPAPSGRSFQEEFLASCGPEIEARVEFHGRLEEEGLAAVRERCSLAVLPSLYESFGLVHVEAMAHGLPVVAFDISATREVVVDGHTGILAPAGDSAALAAGICRLLDDAQLSEAMSRQAAKHARERFSIASMAACVEGAYEKAIDLR